MATAIHYDLIIIGSGSATNILEPIIQRNPKIKIALIDKDEPGGICLTRGCIPSKIMLYPAELVRTIEEAQALGIDAEIKKVDYVGIMERMRALIDKDINSIRQGLSASRNIDYYQSVAEFVGPYELKVQDKYIRSEMIFLATGSQPVVPKIKGLESVGYQTSDSIIRMEMMKLPESLAIIGGGYIAAEFGHFFSAMGARVTIIGRNPQFLPQEEPEVSELAKRELGKHMTILTGHEVLETEMSHGQKKKRITALETRSGRKAVVEAEEILVAVGRGPLGNILHPERAGIKTTKDGWIQVNEYLETSQPNVWAMGDADGNYPFRHVANYESEVVYYNAILKQKIKVDYHAVPHAVFTVPEIAAVGLREREASQFYGANNLLIGYERYEDTAKGEAMNVKNYFVKVIVNETNGTILGAHIIGPQASVLIQEIINLMYAPGHGPRTMLNALHIHPALSEVVQRAFGSLMPLEHYHEHVLAEILPNENG
jgi:dihydrolipoamide dehydrogenase